MDQVEVEVIAVIRGIAGSGKPIGGATSVNFDLHIDGNDASELLEVIKARFHTKFDGFDWDAYFTDEAPVLSSPVCFLRQAERKSLTVGELVEAVRRGAWFED